MAYVGSWWLPKAHGTDGNNYNEAYDDDFRDDEVTILTKMNMTLTVDITGCGSQSL